MSFMVHDGLNALDAYGLNSDAQSWFISALNLHPLDIGQTWNEGRRSRKKKWRRRSRRSMRKRRRKRRRRRWRQNKRR